TYFGATLWRVDEPFRCLHFRVKMISAMTSWWCAHFFGGALGLSLWIDRSTSALSPSSLIRRCRLGGLMPRRLAASVRLPVAWLIASWITRLWASSAACLAA